MIILRTGDILILKSDSHFGNQEYFTIDSFDIKDGILKYVSNKEGKWLSPEEIEKYYTKVIRYG